MTEY